MTSVLHSITFDCADPERVGRFWAEVTGYADDPDNPNSPGDPVWVLMAPGRAHQLLFVPVSEAKDRKNRVHLDLQPSDRTRDEEVDRLLGLGATLVADHRREDGSGFVVLADVEGNELCIERSVAERSVAERSVAERSVAERA